MAYKLFDLAKDVLEKSEKPLTYQEIWAKAVEEGFADKLQTTGKTPWQSLGARLFVDVRDNENSLFFKVGKRPARFFLKSKQNLLPVNIIEKIEQEEARPVREKSKYSERDLHKLLAYFVYANPSFSRDKNIITKTIYHEKSKKSRYNEWLHPDMVGFYIPLDDWNPNLIEFNRLSDNNVLQLYSFELKKSIKKGNYRQSFFQAVSNSSWAHEGYLVCAEITNDDDLITELQRLSVSFGIGIIVLDLNDFDSSSILFPAKRREVLDWETMNKLSDHNSDFDKFLQDVRIDFESKRIHKSEFDEVINDPEEYIRKIMSHK